MPVISTNITEGPDVQASGQYQGKIEFVFHNGDIVTRSVMAANQAEWDALPAALTPEVELSMSNKEIDWHLTLLETDIDPYFDDMGGWFQKKTDFQHTTWDDSFAKNIKYYLSLPDMLELLNIKETIDRISNTDLKLALDISQTQATDIRADIQIAVDTQAALDLYQPLFDSDGVLIP